MYMCVAQKRRAALVKLQAVGAHCICGVNSAGNIGVSSTPVHQQASIQSAAAQECHVQKTLAGNIMVHLDPPRGTRALYELIAERIGLKVRTEYRVFGICALVNSSARRQGRFAASSTHGHASGWRCLATVRTLADATG